MTRTAPPPLARRLARWLKTHFEPGGMTDISTLQKLNKYGITVNIETTASGNRIATLMLDDSVSKITVKTWADAYADMVKRGLPFILVDPDHEGAPHFRVATGPAETDAIFFGILTDLPVADDDDDDDDDGVPVLVARSLDDIPIMMRLAFGWLGASRAERDTTFVYANHVAGALCRLVLGTNPGRDKYLPENGYLACLEALRKSA